MDNPCRVAIFGAGAGGLVVCRRLLEQSTEPSIDVGHRRPIKLTVFEQSDHVGGTWYYTDKTGIDHNGLPIHSSMYKSLRTNLAKELMAFRDFPFAVDGTSFPHHTEVLHYLNDYCDANDLRKHIKLNVRVTKVSPIRRPHCPDVWHVEIQNVIDRTSQIQKFDAIAVCTGHYEIPKYPRIKGLDKFQWTMHSHDYRIPKPFSNKRVVCLGAGPSGIDIALDVAKVSQLPVFLCSKYPLPFPSPDCVRLMPWPEACEIDRVVFSDGQQIDEVDVIIVCTGYKHSYPFLVEEDTPPRPLLDIIDNRVTPLYKQLFHARYPSLALFGIQKAVVPFVLMDVQAQVFRRTLDGRLVLPSEDFMTMELNRQLQEAKEQGIPDRHFHKMEAAKMRIYLDDLEEFGRLDSHVPPSVHRYFAEHRQIVARKGFVAYRDVDYGLTKDDFFVRNRDGSCKIETELQ